MKVTVSLIKADVGSVGGHTCPHPSMLDACKKVLSEAMKNGEIIDFYVTRVGDDIDIIMTHDKGVDSPKVHEVAWNAFKEATKVAKKYKLYAAGQDLLSDAFAGTVRGAGPGVAEMEFKERKSEPLVFFLADKTSPAAFNLPLARVFMDPFTTTGLVIDPRIHNGFQFEIVDVIEHKKVLMSAPEEK